MLDDGSNEDTEKLGEVIPLGEEVVSLDVSMEEGNDDNEVEEGIGDDLISLVGVQLGGVAIDDEDGDRFARIRYEAAPHKNF